jgi:hypothetical protein
MAAIAEAVKEIENSLQDFQGEEIDLVVRTLKRFQEQVATSRTTQGASQPEESVSSQEAPLIQALVGRTYTRQETLELELESLFRYFERRRQLLWGALSATEVAKLLGTSRQTPHDRMKSQTLLGVLERGAYRFPAWQFDPEGPDGVIDGLPEVLRVLAVSDFAKLNWLMRPNPFLDGLTPLVALKQGLKARVIREAAAVGAR